MLDIHLGTHKWFSFDYCPWKISSQQPLLSDPHPEIYNGDYLLAMTICCFGFCNLLSQILKEHCESLNMGGRTDQFLLASINIEGLLMLFPFKSPPLTTFSQKSQIWLRDFFVLLGANQNIL